VKAGREDYHLKIFSEASPETRKPFAVVILNQKSLLSEDLKIQSTYQATLKITWRPGNETEEIYLNWK
jgi:hypothetical protein